MVRAARTDKLLPDERCFLALSTVYGLRREEMGTLHPKDINLRKNSIYIATVKFGKERYHIIPPEIKPYLVERNFDKVYALATISVIFKKILVKSGLRDLQKLRLGWHTIRWAISDGLIDAGVNMMAARTFLRWKSATGDMAMPARCYGNVVITIEEAEPVLKEAKSDESIFAKHPFLGFWRADV